jgi:transposase
MVNSRGIRLLTPREEQVVALVADGLSNREVAQEFRLSEHTIKKISVQDFRQAGNFKPRGIGVIRSQPRQLTPSRMDRRRQCVNELD